jgi:hypothetical protein
MTEPQKHLIASLDKIIDSLAALTDLIEAAFDTHPQLPLDGEETKD